MANHSTRNSFLLCMGIITITVIIASCTQGPAQKADDPNTMAYGTEITLLKDSLIAKSEGDCIALIEGAREKDFLSISQMIAGGSVWSQPAGSRVTFLGAGAYSNAVEVRTMDGKEDGRFRVIFPSLSNRIRIGV